MKAVVQREYGPADIRHVADVEPPDIGEDEVLARVMAASAHAGAAPLMLMAGSLRMLDSRGLRPAVAAAGRALLVG